MQRAKGIKALKLLLALMLMTFLVLSAWAISLTLFPAQPNYDQLITHIDLRDSIIAVGYRNNVGGATVPFTYDFFILADGVEPEDTHPFLQTRTPAVEILREGPQHIGVKVQGEITSFHNRVWLNRPSDEPITVNIDLHASSR